jgi:hypothetical protein
MIDEGGILVRGTHEMMVGLINENVAIRRELADKTLQI